MRILAIETSAAACSVALFDHGTLIAHAHQRIGRGHAEHLIPMISALPGKGRADEIRVDCGPGSFTGLRVGLAAAKGLGLAWQVPVRGFGALTLIAAGHWPVGEARAAVVVEGGHGEYFVQQFSHPPLTPRDEARSLAPSVAVATVDETHVIGAAAATIVALRGWGDAIAAEADARHALAIPDKLLRAQAAPIYGRAPDAKPLP